MVWRQPAKALKYCAAIPVNFLDIQKKDITDLVTNADIESGKAIIQTIRDKYPGYALMAEESGELFSAIKGRGAVLNGNPIRVSDSKGVQDSLLVTGFPYDVKPVFPELMTRFSHCLKAARGIRGLGSAALDLCFVACGRFEGYWEENLKPWNTAAGMLIATEAGARVTDFSNRPYRIDGNQILATNRQIHDEMLSLLAIEVKI